MSDEKNISRGGKRMTAGRKPGVPNRTTRESRAAIALFVEQNLPRLDNWLQQLANGLPKVDANGEVIRDKQGSVVYVVKPDVGASIKAVSDICEYHLPKLMRSDVAVVAQVENIHTLEVSQLTSQQLQERVAMFLGMTEPNTIEGESVEIPEWLNVGPENG